MSHGVRGGVRAARAEPRRDEVVRAWPRLSVALVADLVATEGLLRRQQDADVGDMRSDDDGATLDDLREAIKLLEEVGPTARRVYGGAHPLAEGIEFALESTRAALAARETPEQLAQDAFRTAREKLAQERTELAKTLAGASARPPK